MKLSSLLSNSFPTYLQLKLRSLLGVVAISALCLTINSHLIAQQTIYVDQSNTTGANNGSSWADAYTSFDSAIYDQSLQAGDTVHIAKGTYTPSVQGNAFFISVGNLHIYGGFPSGGGMLGDRNWEADSTILMPNGHSVLYLDDTYETTVNGFYITGGNGMWGGGGIFNNAENNTFENLVIFENTAGMAGGMYNNEGGYNVSLKNVVFKNNQSIYEDAWGSGGGLYNNANNLTISNCRFENNHAEGDNGATGGGINNMGDNLSISNTDFISNSVFCEDGFSTGGAINSSGNNFELKNCNFEQNSVTLVNQGGKGGAIRHEGGNMLINNCSFSENEISSELDYVNGGAIAIEGQNPCVISIINSSFIENKATSQNNDASGGAIDMGGNTSTELSIINTVFRENKSISETGKADGGAIRVSELILSLTNVMFTENSAVSTSVQGTGGAVHSSNGAQLTINKALFAGNFVSGVINPTVGGALFSGGGSSQINNAVFIDNATTSTQGESYGGALVFFSGQNTVSNSTFLNNSADGNVVLGGAIATVSLTSQNNIFWGNKLNGDVTNGDITTLGQLIINNSFTQTDFTGVGTGNILGVTSPFIDVNNPAGLDGIWGTLDDGLAPICGSLVIDAGDDTVLDPSITQDFRGMMRYKNTIDMGAYEFNGIVQNVDSVAFCGTYTWNGNTYTESGIYTHVTGTDANGCELVETLVLTPNNTMQIVEDPQDNNICINTAFTSVSYQTTNVSEVHVISGLPNGVTAQYSNNAIVLSGTPTEAGTFVYVLHVKGCGEEWIVGKLEVLPIGVVTAISNAPLLVCEEYLFLESVANASNVQEIISYDGLPEGVDPLLFDGQLHFIGEATETGTFNYTIVFSGCENVTFQGEITVIEDNTTTALNENLIVCLNSTFEEITHQVTGPMSAIDTVMGLPDGVSFSFENNELIIAGSPTETGVFDYTIIPVEGCNEITGTIQVDGTATVDGATQFPTTCLNYAITDVFHYYDNISTVGVIDNLPDGLTVELLEDVIKISGAPTEEGVFNYSITLNGACNDVIATGMITVNAQPTIEQNIEATTCFGVEMDTLFIEGTGLIDYGSSTGLPDGINAEFINGEVVITGTPTESGTFSYEITMQTDCEDIVSEGTLYITPNYTVTNTSSIEEICVGSPMNPIAHTTSGVDAIASISGLPNGLTANLTNGILVVSGTPTETGTFNYTISFESQLCGNATAQGQIIVDTAPQVDLGEDLVFCDGEEINVVLDAGSADTYLWSNGETSQTIEVTEAGTISVTVSNTNGCTATDSMEIIEGQAPTVTVSLLEGNILKASAQFADYQWLNCDTEEVIPGENGSIFIPTENGNYAVMVTNQAGCTTISDCIAVSTVGIHKEEWSNLLVYPNPTKDRISIDFGQLVNSANLKVRDITGKLLFNEKVSNTDKHNLSLEKFAKGIYLIEIELNGNQRKVIKVIRD